MLRGLDDALIYKPRGNVPDSVHVVSPIVRIQRPGYLGWAGCFRRCSLFAETQNSGRDFCIFVFY